MSDQLKPCPCCGGGAKIDADGSVYCVKCGIQTAVHSIRGMAIEVWNSRPSFVVPSVEEIEILVSKHSDKNLGPKCPVSIAIATAIHSHLLAQGAKESVAWEALVKADFVTKHWLSLSDSKGWVAGVISEALATRKEGV